MPFPEMPTPQHSPSVIAYQKWLVVAGGKTGRDFRSNTETHIQDSGMKDHRYLVDVQKHLQPSMVT